MSQLPQDSASEENNGEDALTWQEIAEKNIAISESIIEEMVKNEDKLPQELFNAANAISTALSDINVCNYNSALSIY